MKAAGVGFVRSLLLLDIQPDDLDPVTLWKLVVQVLTEPEPREKLPNVNTLDDVLSLLCSSQNIMVLTGAGVSSREILHLLNLLVSGDFCFRA